MLRPQDQTSTHEDPVTRATIARLRVSVAGVVLGTVLTMFIAGIAVRSAWTDGRQAATQPMGASSSAKASSSRHLVANRSSRGASRSTGKSQMTGEPAVKPDTGPGLALLLTLFGSIGVIGSGMFLLVRRPYITAREQANLLVRAIDDLEAGTLEALAALNATVEAKDRYTAGHGLRVTLISMLIAQELSLDDESIDMLRHAATFHDIGKIAVPDAVLQKPGRLTDSEFEAMKIHAVESERICTKLAVLHNSLPSIRAHHERMDGRGYPDGLVGRKIPLGARIISVADTWDAITSDRPYRRGQPATVALAEILRVSGSQLDEHVVEAFLEVLAKDPWMFGLTPEQIANRHDLTEPPPTSHPRSSDDDAAHVVVALSDDDTMPRAA